MGEKMQVHIGNSFQMVGIALSAQVQVPVTSLVQHYSEKIYKHISLLFWFLEV